MSKAFLFVRNLSKTFGRKKAVDGVSFEVYRGEIYSLLGPNGSGKTTLLSIIAGILSPDSGEVLINGLRPVDVEARKLIGYCPQESVVYDELTGYENLMFYARLHGLGDQAKSRCKELLRSMKLADYADKKVATYSGGMKKRLNFAISLLGDPELLLLDEPTVGLDPSVRRLVWDILLDLRKEGKSILLATHYMEEADRLADRVAIMNLGKILVEDDPEALKRNFGARAVIRVKLSGGDVKDLMQITERGIWDRVIYEDDVLKFFVHNPDQAIPSLTSLLSKKGLKLEELKVIRPTLEDVFLNLTGRRL